HDDVATVADPMGAGARPRRQGDGHERIRWTVEVEDGRGAGTWCTVRVTGDGDRAGDERRTRAGRGVREVEGGDRAGGVATREDQRRVDAVFRRVIAQPTDRRDRVVVRVPRR